VFDERLRDFLADPPNSSGRFSRSHSFARKSAQTIQAPIIPRIFPAGRLLLAVVAVLAIFAAGCRKKQLTSAEIHGITEELVAAAQNAGGRQTQITIRHETQPGSWWRRGFSTDQLNITLNDPSREPLLVEALVAVARKHDLTRGPISSSGDRFDLFRDSQRTHTIRIVESAAAAPHPRQKLPPNAVRLAIIVDDLGKDIAPARELLKLPYPLTVSIIPNLSDSTEIAEEAFRRGDEILLHFPMQASEPGAKSEAVELRVGMQPRQVSDMLASMLASVPHASGVNNHQGSRATSDPALMNALMPALRQRGLFFVDSRTTVETVAYTSAERDGVPATFRSAQFLDDVETRAAILLQLDRAASHARRKGWAVTIGHPHAATIAALREGLPRLEARGIHLVFVSDVLK
jgi:polysaccharide deacetylase 2 family uncharacterized protein YibQ